MGTRTMGDDPRLSDIFNDHTKEVLKSEGFVRRGNHWYPPEKRWSLMPWIRAGKEKILGVKVKIKF